MKRLSKIFFITTYLFSCFFTINAQEKNTSNEEKKWIDAGYKNAQISNLNFNKFYTDTDSDNFTHDMDLILVNLRGSGWDKELIIKTIQKTAEVYEQCGIKIKNVKYIEAYSPIEKLDISYNDYDHYKFGYKLPVANRPVLFFIRSNVEGKTATTFPSDKETPPISNIAFITFEVNKNEYKLERPEGYSPTAHELAHILCGCSEHNKIKKSNILTNYYDLRDNTITKEQCVTFKSKGMELGILRKL
ncbi:hypothetical protein [Algibacter luteus]|uniref:hypothetical protein n=1 Tax=Algibacter luteus TaxID=1178825 RepID=UPI002595B600|nr:hypothetical protein [Algibacter luteus]WJJ96525.1 hypothetical protein O5O44_15030 [Algibacter luteus]